MEGSVNFDNEVLAYLSNRKDELIVSHQEYIASHPEIREVLNDFISSVLLHKPVRFKLSNSLEWCLRFRKGVLPPFQPCTVVVQTTDRSWSFRRWKARSYISYSR